MQVNIRAAGDVQVVELDGEIDGRTGPEVQGQILPIIEPGSKVLLNMSQVAYMSSAGLRVLLSLYRQGLAQESQVVLAGLIEEIEDTMSATGFLRFFTIFESVEDGLAALQQ